ncbi:unnamed protein product [Amoebophrya sp. A120]|nr:unnamed protein product [Amoebophrya sp. A120]|eukprot:GSA120T00019527001.1
MSSIYALQRQPKRPRRVLTFDPEGATSERGSTADKVTVQPGSYATTTTSSAKLLTPPSVEDTPGGNATGEQNDEGTTNEQKEQLLTGALKIEELQQKKTTYGVRYMYKGIVFPKTSKAKNKATTMKDQKTTTSSSQLQLLSASTSSSTDEGSSSGSASASSSSSSARMSSSSSSASGTTGTTATGEKMRKKTKSDENDKHVKIIDAIPGTSYVPMFYASADDFDNLSESEIDVLHGEQVLVLEDDDDAEGARLSSTSKNEDEKSTMSEVQEQDHTSSGVRLVEEYYEISEVTNTDEENVENGSALVQQGLFGPTSGPPHGNFHQFHPTFNAGAATNYNPFSYSNNSGLMYGASSSSIYGAGFGSASGFGFGFAPPPPPPPTNNMGNMSALTLQRMNEYAEKRLNNKTTGGGPFSGATNGSYGNMLSDEEEEAEGQIAGAAKKPKATVAFSLRACKTTSQPVFYPEKETDTRKRKRPFGLKYNKKNKEDDLNVIASSSNHAFSSFRAAVAGNPGGVTTLVAVKKNDPKKAGLGAPDGSAAPKPRKQRPKGLTYKIKNQPDGVAASRKPKERKKYHLTEAGIAQRRVAIKKAAKLWRKRTPKNSDDEESDSDDDNMDVDEGD